MIHESFIHGADVQEELDRIETQFDTVVQRLDAQCISGTSLSTMRMIYQEATNVLIKKYQFLFRVLDRERDRMDDEQIALRRDALRKELERQLCELAIATDQRLANVSFVG